jgi:hypothetical protein
MLQSYLVKFAKPAGNRRLAVSMILGLNLLQSLIERRPEKASLVCANATSEVRDTLNRSIGKIYVIFM